MGIPIYLTLSRLVISPIFIIFYLYCRDWGIVLPLVLIALLIVCEITDLLDGFVARRTNQVTQLGKVLDPMADSIARLSILFAFTQGVVALPLLLILVFLYRDTIISTLRTLCALRGVALAARMSGKVKAVVQAVTIFVILFAMMFETMGLLSMREMRLISFYTVLVAALYTVFSGVEYLWVNRSFIKKSINP